LFGHLKGAYTGAESAREGMVAKGEEGTLFLDEIGDLAPESQIKLLRLLQEREYYPLGTDRPRATSARFIFATNIDIAKETRFRKDLLYRLRSHHIRIPPLRERTGDLPALVDHFLDKASQAVGKKRPTVPRELLPLVRGYSFSEISGSWRACDFRRWCATNRACCLKPAAAQSESGMGTADEGQELFPGGRNLSKLARHATRNSLPFD
jgi:transcriptional regulator of aromatic amino acid metabolism